MSEWKKVPLDKMGVISRGKSKHRPRNDVRLFGGEYPFIQTGDIGNAGLYVQNYSQTYNEEGLAQSKLWDKDTLCITIAANIADTALLAFPACFPDSIMGFVPYKDVSNVKYVKYCFDILKKDCQQISQGTAQDNLSWKKLSTILFPCPPLEVQNRIAEILSRYDSLIENYQKQIKLLEESAQRLYKEWFVDLHFPGHENTKIVDGVPEGWEKKMIGEVCDTTSGGTPSRSKTEFYTGNIPWVKTKELNDDFIFETEERITDDAIRKSSAKLIPSGSILMAMYGATIGKLGIATKELSCNQACCVFLLSEDNVLRFYLYSWLLDNRTLLISMGKGAAQPNLSQDMIKKLEIVIPSLHLLSIFDSKVKSIYKKIYYLSSQIRLLTEARDRLLPKLMSGEIAV